MDTCRATVGHQVRFQGLCGSPHSLEESSQFIYAVLHAHHNAGVEVQRYFVTFGRPLLDAVHHPYKPRAHRASEKQALRYPRTVFPTIVSEACVLVPPIRRPRRRLWGTRSVGVQQYWLDLCTSTASQSTWYINRADPDLTSTVLLIVQSTMLSRAL